MSVVHFYRKLLLCIAFYLSLFFFSFFFGGGVIVVEAVLEDRFGALLFFWLRLDVFFSNFDHCFSSAWARHLFLLEGIATGTLLQHLLHVVLS